MVVVNFGFLRKKEKDAELKWGEPAAGAVNNVNVLLAPILMAGGTTLW
jgi:hypothetical protein